MTEKGAQPSASPKPTSSNRTSWLANKKWAGVGGIAAIVAVAIAIPSLSKDGARSTVTNNGTVGDCAAVGDSNNINCQILQQRFGKSQITINPLMDGRDWLFTTPASSLPSPPAYRNAFFHCPEWKNWLLGNDRAYSLRPGADLLLAAGTSENVSIRRLEVRVFSKEPVPKVGATKVACNFGAGGDTGFLAHVNLASSTTTLTVNDSSPAIEDALMPPASVHAQDNSELSGVVFVDSTPGYLYEGQIVATAAINGSERIVTLGSSSEPYRWVHPDTEVRSEPVAWNSKTGKWVTGFGFRPPDA